MRLGQHTPYEAALRAAPRGPRRSGPRGRSRRPGRRPRGMPASLLLSLFRVDMCSKCVLLFVLVHIVCVFPRGMSASAETLTLLDYVWTGLKGLWAKGQ